MRIIKYFNGGRIGYDNEVVKHPVLGEVRSSPKSQDQLQLIGVMKRARKAMGGEFDARDEEKWGRPRRITRCKGEYNGSEMVCELVERETTHHLYGARLEIGFEGERVFMKQPGSYYKYPYTPVENKEIVSLIDKIKLDGHVCVSDDAWKNYCYLLAAIALGASASPVVGVG